MSLRVLDIPDDPAPWLDRELVGLDLAEIVAALEVVHAKKAASPPPTLDDLVADRLPAVLDHGLAALPAPALQKLLRHPRLLLELQERVLVEGSDYWQDLVDDNEELASLTRDTWPGIARRLGQGESGTEAPAPIPSTRPTPPRVRLIRAWAKLATIAASMLGLLYFAERQTPRPSSAAPRVVKVGRAPWGWSARDLTVVELASTYLNNLADDAEHWRDERPEDAPALALRLGELRSGCSRLIVSRHPSLSPTDRAWLVSHCHTWAAKLDDAIHGLEAGRPVEQVRPEADAIVDRLVDLLREHARSAA
jgi:hypothetical protein